MPVAKRPPQARLRSATPPPVASRDSDAKATAVARQWRALATALRSLKARGPACSIPDAGAHHISRKFLRRERHEKGSEWTWIPVLPCFVQKAQIDIDKSPPT